MGVAAEIMASVISATAAELATEDLEDWGFRAGAGPGECKISGKVLCNADGVKTGIWQCEPGSFDVPKRENTESVTIMAGRVKITDLDSGKEVELTTGDALVLPKGSSAKWTIIETCRKFFVIAS